MTIDSAETAIRVRRKLTNRLIAEHKSERLRPFFAEDLCVIAGDGGLVLGPAAMIAAFEAQFRDPAFIAYERTTETVGISEGAMRAAEHGRWVGTWRGGVEMRGVYLAVWRAVRGQWMIERELYVTMES